MLTTVLCEKFWSGFALRSPDTAKSEGQRILSLKSVSICSPRRTISWLQRGGLLIRTPTLWRKGWYTRTVTMKCFPTSRFWLWCTSSVWKRNEKNNLHYVAWVEKSQFGNLTYYTYAEWFQILRTNFRSSWEDNLEQKVQVTCLIHHPCWGMTFHCLFRKWNKRLFMYRFSYLYSTSLFITFNYNEQTTKIIIYWLILVFILNCV
jgi:hypothetical protein